MKKFILAFCLALASLPSMANPDTDHFGTCLADNTTGKERKELAAWIFMAMAAHPDIRDFSKITPAAREASDKAMAALFMKLITETCSKEARLAVKNGGVESFKTAFEVLGRVAMQELMSNPEVNTSIRGFQQYLDEKKLQATLTEK